MWPFTLSQKERAVRAFTGPLRDTLDHYEHRHCWSADVVAEAVNQSYPQFRHYLPYALMLYSDHCSRLAYSDQHHLNLKEDKLRKELAQLY